VTDRFDGARVFDARLRGDRQLSADRLDPELVFVQVDIGDHLVKGRSSSAAKKADALFRITFARCSSLTSRSNSTIRVASRRVVGRRSRPQAGIDLGLLNLAAPRVRRDTQLLPDPSARTGPPSIIVAGIEHQGTARAFNSGGYFFRAGMILNLPDDQEPPETRSDSDTSRTGSAVRAFMVSGTRMEASEK
jgi:hypothetical protein